VVDVVDVTFTCDAGVCDRDCDETNVIIIVKVSSSS